MSHKPRLPLTPHERTMLASIGGLTSWANTKDRAARTAPARENSPTSVSYWEAKVDPDQVMSPGDRRKAAENARRAYFKTLAFKSARARRARKQAGQGDGAA